MRLSAAEEIGLEVLLFNTVKTTKLTLAIKPQPPPPPKVRLSATEEIGLELRGAADAPTDVHQVCGTSIELSDITTTGCIHTAASFH